MEFSFREYQKTKIKFELKRVKIFAFSNGTKLRLNSWMAIEKELNKLKFSYYKVNNKACKTTIINSIYKNLDQIVSSMLYILKPKNKILINEKLKIITNQLPFLVLVLKLNNKIYTLDQINKVDNLVNYLFKINNFIKILLFLKKIM